MANRAAPRKSTLAGSSPVTTPAQPTSLMEAEGNSPETKLATTQAGPPTAPAAAKKTKVAYYHDADMAARLRGAFQATAHLEGHRSLSDFHAAIMEAELHRLEAKYNNGQPYQGAAPKSGRLGRPLD